MAPSRPTFARLLALACLPAAHSHRLVVCVISATNLPNIDRDQRWSASASDAFVGVSVQSEQHFTTVHFDEASPQWDECFSFAGEYAADSQITFVVQDADRRKLTRCCITHLQYVF